MVYALVCFAVCSLLSVAVQVYRPKVCRYGLWFNFYGDRVIMFWRIREGKKYVSSNAVKPYSTLQELRDDQDSSGGNGGV